MKYPLDMPECPLGKFPPARLRAPGVLLLYLLLTGTVDNVKFHRLQRCTVGISLVLIFPLLNG